MSTDFTGKNKGITNDSLYMTLSDKLSQYLNVDRDKLYRKYAEKNLCEGCGNWTFFDRYNKEFDSNDYTGNKFTDIAIIKETIGREEFSSKDISTADERRDKLFSLCSGLIENNLCESFSITGLFPHLDCPGEIISIEGVSGAIPCIGEDGAYETLYANISYTDSCGEGLIEPVPYYPSGWDSSLSGDITVKSTLDDLKYGVDAEYHWTIRRNANQVTIDPTTSGMTSAYLNVATLSTAFKPDINVELSYDEKD